MESMISPEELAEALGIPIGTLYHWRHRGKGPKAVKIGKHLRYRRTTVDAWLEAQESRGGPQYIAAHIEAAEAS